MWYLTLAPDTWEIFMGGALVPPVIKITIAEFTTSLFNTAGINAWSRLFLRAHQWQSLMVINCSGHWKQLEMHTCSSCNARQWTMFIVIYYGWFFTWTYSNNNARVLMDRICHSFVHSSRTFQHFGDTFLQLWSSSTVFVTGMTTLVLNRTNRKTILSATTLKTAKTASSVSRFGYLCFIQRCKFKSMFGADNKPRCLYFIRSYSCTVQN